MGNDFAKSQFQSYSAIYGVKSFERALSTFPEEVTKELAAVNIRQGNALKQLWQFYLATDGRRGAEKIARLLAVTRQRRGLEVKVGLTTKRKMKEGAHWIWLERGIDPHPIVAKNAKFLADVKRELVFGRGPVQHPGMRGKPFRQRAERQVLSRYDPQKRAALEKVMKEVVRKARSAV